MIQNVIYLGWNIRCTPSFKLNSTYIASPPPLCRITKIQVLDTRVLQLKQVGAHRISSRLLRVCGDHVRGESWTETSESGMHICIAKFESKQTKSEYNQQHYCRSCWLLRHVMRTHGFPVCIITKLRFALDDLLLTTPLDPELPTPIFEYCNSLATLLGLIIQLHKSFYPAFTNSKFFDAEVQNGCPIQGH